jgi:hypothetical protein
MIRLLLSKLISKKSRHTSNSFMTNKETLEKSINKCLNEIDRDASNLRKNLTESGMSDFQVTRIIAFLPEVCQRVIFKNRSHIFTKEYIFVSLNSKNQLKGDLLEDEIYLECLRIVDRSSKFFYNRRKLNRIAAKSSSSQLIRIALENGSNIENLYFGPMMVMFDEIPSELLEKP